MTSIISAYYLQNIPLPVQSINARVILPRRKKEINDTSWRKLFLHLTLDSRKSES